MLEVLFLIYRLALSFWVPEEFPLLSHSHLPLAFYASRDLFGCCIPTLIRRQLQRNTCGERISRRFPILPVASTHTREVWGWAVVWVQLPSVAWALQNLKPLHKFVKSWLFLKYSGLWWVCSLCAPLLRIVIAMVIFSVCLFFLASVHDYLKFSLLSLLWLTGGFLEG